MTETVYDSSIIRCKAGDVPFDLSRSVVDQNQNAIDLSTATAVLVLESVGDDGPVEELRAAASIDVNTVSYSWSVGDLASAGMYYGRFIITFDTGHIISIPQKGYIEIEVESLST